MRTLYFAWADPPFVPGSATTSYDGVGTGTMGSVTVASTAMIGDYRVICKLVEENGGTFEVRYPDGQYVGDAAVGTEFTGGGLTFTISDGATDFALEDEFTISVSTEPGETFDAETHARHDDAAFRIVLTESEGQFPSATLRVKTPVTGLLAPGRKRWAFISEDDGAGGATLLFSGRLTGFPTAVDEGTSEIELIAQPPDWNSKLAALAATLRVAPYYDALFVQDPAHPRPEDCLAGRPAYFHWNRATGALSLQNILTGSSTVAITGHNWKSFSFSVADSPVRRIAVSVECQWAQQASGDVDISDEIRNELGDDPDYISTLSGDDFAARWPRAGQGIGDASGYVVKSSSLTKVLPGLPSGCIEWESGKGLSTGQLVFFPPTMEHAEVMEDHIASDFYMDVATSYLGNLTSVDDSSRPLRSAAATIPTADYPTGFPTTDLATPTREIRAERSWFDPELSIGWNYSQARQERAYAMLVAGVQAISIDDGRTETMDFTLADITIDAITPAWRTGTAYEVDDLVRFAGVQFRCLAAHTAGPWFGIDEFQGRWVRLSVDQSALGNVRLASFFQTARGRQAFEHALARAAAKIVSASRCVEVRFVVPWDVGRDITTANSVTITDPRLPAGDPVTGKVTSVTSERSTQGETQYGATTITMALCIGDGATPSPRAGDYEVSGIDGLIYADYSAQATPEPVNLSSMETASYVVREIEVENDVETQNSAFAAATIDPVSAVSPTTISFRLRALAADDVITHDISVSTPFAYSPPKQIDLGAT